MAVSKAVTLLASLIIAASAKIQLNRVNPMNVTHTAVTPKLRQSSERVVIYMDYKISWNDIGSDIKAAVDMGATVVVLGFWMHDRGGVDAAQTWESTSQADKNAVLQYIHAKGAILMVSAGGATENVEQYVKDNNPTGAAYGSAVAKFAKDNMLDGVDFDLELAPGASGPFKDGTFISWAVAATKAAKQTLGTHDSVISHAPQGPYLSPEWAGSKAGYVEIFKQARGDIDFLFIQFYNQGPGVYDTYEQLFVKPGASWAAGSAVEDIIKSGIPPQFIVIGKPVAAAYASNGMVPPATLAEWINTARKSFDYDGGVGGWMYATKEKDTCVWLNAMATTTSRKPSTTC
eukprot:m.12990 g.12990  ORF g.12990 m.12990 type:complete len:346 (+) comp4765_c0_seq1:44-1081(+)